MGTDPGRGKEAHSGLRGSTTTGEVPSGHGHIRPQYGDEARGDHEPAGTGCAPEGSLCQRHRDQEHRGPQCADQRNGDRYPEKTHRRREIRICFLQRKGGKADRPH